MKKLMAIAAILAVIGYACVSSSLIIKGRDYKKTSAELKIKLDSAKIVIDSLRSENFIQHTTIDRYDIAIEMLKEEDPRAWEKLDWILSHSVE